MNRITAIALVFTATFITLGGAAAQATTLDAKIPFAFVVQKRLLPAGTYRISSVGSNFVQIGTQDKPIMETIATHADNNGPGWYSPSMATSTSCAKFSATPRLLTPRCLPQSWRNRFKSD
jgi:hypothetical protein